jgi:hypothetical protein
MTLQECLNTAEAYKARKIMKYCEKPCLQTCWARPQADSLPGIIDALINKMRKNRLDKKARREILSSALASLSHYEEMLKK